ncbi:MAG TPA: lysophospholipid acyltransferase family protein [Kofleriaceae bacterium]|nr:lysophospholipid acyltransferase family protein [Kofleriaceae bacterium]
MRGYEVVRHAGAGLLHALSELGAARMAPPRDARAAAHRLAGALATIARAHDLSVEIRGEVPRGCALVVANHVSYLDPLAILPICPAAPLAKAGVARWPIVGNIGGALGVVFVERETAAGRIRALRRVHALLAAGVSVLNFPEGTTNRDEIGGFYRGTFGIAQRLGVTVVPVAVRYRDPALAWCGGATFVPHYASVAARTRVDVTVTFCSPMPPRTGERPETFAARARQAIAHVVTR